MNRYLTLLILTLTLGSAWGQPASELPMGPGRDLVFTKCQQCHDLSYVLDSAGLDRAGWEDIVNLMIDMGLELTEEEYGTILNYLSNYLGPNPPPVAQGEGKPDHRPVVSGADVYQRSCAGCHGAKGQGVPGSFPPLAENPYLFKDRTYPALVVLFGLSGEIEVKGQTYSGFMPSFAHLSDQEIAAVVAFIRNNFGNEKLRPEGFEDLTPEEIKALREKGLQAKDVHALREKLK